MLPYCSENHSGWVVHSGMFKLVTVLIIPCSFLIMFWQLQEVSCAFCHGNCDGVNDVNDFMFIFYFTLVVIGGELYSDWYANGWLFIVYSTLPIIAGELCIWHVGNSDYAHDLMSILHATLAIIVGELCNFACWLMWSC